jgi:diaminopimelate decarboxylase
VVPGGWSGQFGEAVTTGAALAAYAEAASHPELEVSSLHCHLGEEISTASQLLAFVDRVLAFVDVLYAKLGIEVKSLDLGGSLACPTTTPLTREQVERNRDLGLRLTPRLPASVLSIPGYLETLVTRVESHFRSVGRARPRIFLEPGRAMTANTQLLLCRVALVKHGGELPHVILDAGMNVAQSCQDEYHQLFVAHAPRSDRRRLYRLVGPICTPGDILYYGWELPELAPGDVLAVMDSGAYFVPFGTSFSFPQPAIVRVENGQTTLLRRAERYEDLISLDES